MTQITLETLGNCNIYMLTCLLSWMIIKRQTNLQIWFQMFLCFWGDWYSDHYCVQYNITDNCSWIVIFTMKCFYSVQLLLSVWGCLDEWKDWWRKRRREKQLRTKSEPETRVVKDKGQFPKKFKSWFTLLLRNLLKSTQRAETQIALLCNLAVK